jgi:KDO2-lipid IV(A) lauroyltransferase
MMGAGVGAVAWRVLASARRLALENLAAAFPETDERERARIGRAAMVNLGRAGMEFLMLFARRRTRIEQWCVAEGDDRLRQAAAGGRGVVFVTGHTGNWELLAALVTRLGFPTTVVATPVYDPNLDAVLVAARAAQGVETISRGSPSAARQLLSALRRNAVLGLLIDQDTDVEGAFVPFFGRPAYTPTGAAALALRTGAAVVCGFLVREGGSRHRMVVQGPIALVRTGDQQRDVLENTALLTALIETHIRTYPEQWVWFHRRWKRRPEQENVVARSVDHAPHPTPADVGSV